MTIQELVEECNQFIEDDACKLRVEDAKAVDRPVTRWLALQRRQLRALEKRVWTAAQRYFAKA
jgi:hypothetical protein